MSMNIEFRELLKEHDELKARVAELEAEEVENHKRVMEFMIYTLKDLLDYTKALQEEARAHGVDVASYSPILGRVAGVINDWRLLERDEDDELPEIGLIGATRTLERDEEDILRGRSDD